jgi:hypothetical protein
MADFILVLARIGCGKTTLAARLAKDWPSDYIAIHDPMASLCEFPWLEDVEEFNHQSLRPGMLLILDEVDLLAKTHGYEPKWIRDMFHYCRHYQITIIGTARRPANVHKDLTGLVGQVYLGQITEPRDIKYCYDAWGQRAYQAPDLPKYQFMHFRPGE